MSELWINRAAPSLATRRHIPAACQSGGACHHMPGCADTHCPGHPGSYSQHEPIAIRQAHHLIAWMTRAAVLIAFAVMAGMALR